MAEIDVIREALDWNLVLNSVKVELTDEMIKAQLNKFFHPENEEKDSGQ